MLGLGGTKSSVGSSHVLLWALMACSGACAEESSSPNTSTGGSAGNGSAGTSAGTGGQGAGGVGGSSGSAGVGGVGGGGQGGSGADAGNGGNGADGGNGAAGGGGAGGGGAGGTSGGSGGGGGEGATLPDFCPDNSDDLVPTLGNSAEVVQGVPPDDVFAPGWAILEGPLWIDGALYLSEVVNEAAPPNARILKHTPGGETVAFIQPSGSNGLAVDAEGKLLAAQHKPSGAIVRFDPNQPDVPAEVVVPGFEGSPFNSPNDLTLRADGNLYFTDPAWQAPTPPPQAEERAYRFSPKGELSAIAGAPEKPNGISLAPRQNLLYISGTGALTAFPVDANGAVGAGTQFGPRAYEEIDGMAVDCAGTLYLADNTGGQVIVVSRAGVELGVIASLTGVTNLAFGGSDRSTLFITTLGDRPALYTVDVGVPGLPY